MTTEDLDKMEAELREICGPFLDRQRVCAALIAEVRRLRELTTPIPLAERKPPDGEALIWVDSEGIGNSFWESWEAKDGNVPNHFYATHWLPCPPDPTK
jgi:hypothetical protein